MIFSADRVSGLFFFIAGAFTYFFIIPNFVEITDPGSIQPDTFPNALSLTITFCGLILAFKPTTHQLHRLSDFVLTGVYFGLLCLSVLAMTFFGYILVSPVLAMTLMLLIGERRPFWLTCGALIMPALIWLIIEILLGRSLP